MKTNRWCWAVILLFLSCSASSLSANEWHLVTGGAWQPTRAQVNDIKKNLSAFVTREARSNKRALKPWDQYVFQYQGQLEQSRQVVLVNAVCRGYLSSSDAPRDLSGRMVEVLDGGECFFQLKYDVSRDEFIDLFINGQA